MFQVVFNLLWAWILDKNHMIYFLRCVENVILWNNKHILIDGKSVYWKEWHEAGILRIKDLLDEKKNQISHT